jgi:cytoskeletal protein CcmA (bactofilin family)
MALWKEPTTPTSTVKEPEKPNGPAEATQFTPVVKPAEPPARVVANDAPPPRVINTGNQKESVIAANLTIEGKIEGAGHVRIAGSFKGDIQVEGNLTIERGAHLAGEVRADTIIIAGELQGNIQAASRVELMESGTIMGDLKAGSLTVAAGSRMRGKAEFGWDEKMNSKSDGAKRDGSSS